MILTGITDEAGALIDTQIKAVKELGWNTIEARSVEVEGFPRPTFTTSLMKPSMWSKKN